MGKFKGYSAWFSSVSGIENVVPSMTSVRKPRHRHASELTMYDLPASLLVANPIHRYLLNSPMLSQLKKDADGGLTLHIQNESPGKDKEANWLPAPKGAFFMAMRLYWPNDEALEGK